MKTVFKLIRRFVATLMMATIILFLLNLFLMIGLFRDQTGNQSPWKAAEAVSAGLEQDGAGGYILSDEAAQVLELSGGWAVLIDNGTGEVRWNSANLPAEVPLRYSIADLSWAIRGYVADYPTTTAEHGEDLLILGNPKTSLWKLMWNTFDYRMIAGLPQTIAVFVLVNLATLLVIYIIVVSGILRPVRPLIRGIEALPDRQIYVKERGIFASLAKSVNHASEKLRVQERLIQKKDAARANWIAGVSHDIRTPLSMVMGYAGQMEEDSSLPESGRKKAGIIRLQSLRIKNLVNDLNLASRLEYNAQPLHCRPVSLIPLIRGLAADFLNMDGEGRYPIEYQAPEEAFGLVIQADPDLLKRAVSNLILNAQVHNPDGCAITVRVERSGTGCRTTVEDDGVGVTPDQLNSLRSAPHYMVCDSSTDGQRHGLGLLIVRQIAQAHGGRLELGSSPQGGFQAAVFLPASHSAEQDGGSGTEKQGKKDTK